MCWQDSIPREVQEQGIPIDTSLENLVGGNEHLEVSALKCMTAGQLYELEKWHFLIFNIGC